MAQDSYLGYWKACRMALLRVILKESMKVQDFLSIFLIETWWTLLMESWLTFLEEESFWTFLEEESFWTFLVESFLTFLVESFLTFLALLEED